MNKYQNGKIYRINNDIYYMVYIGSTTMELNDRQSYHKDKVRKNSNANVHKHIRTIGIQHFKIILLHGYLCDNKEELLWKEREEMEKYDKNKLLVNNKRSIITKEHKKENYKRNYELKKLYFSEQNKRYYTPNFEKNRDSKNEYNRQYHSKIKWLKLLSQYEVSKNELIYILIIPALKLDNMS